MINWAVYTVFGAKDKVSPTFRRMDKSARRFGHTADSAFRRASRGASHFRGVLKGVLVAFAVRRGLAELQQGTMLLGKSFMDFDDAIYSAVAKIAGLDINSKRGQKALYDLREAALKTARDTKFMATDSAVALDKFMLAGFKVGNAIALLPGSANLATVAQTELNEAVSMSVDLLGAFGMRSTNAVKQAANMAKVNDWLAVATTSANTELRDLYEGAGKGAATFVRAGRQTVPTFLTLMDMLAEAGIKGEEAGTALRNAMLRISAPSSTGRKVLRALGVNVAKDGKNLDDFIEIIERFRKGTADLGSKQQVAAFASVFNVRAATAAAILFKRSREELEAFRNKIIQGTGAMDRMSDIVRKGIGQQWVLVLSNIQSLGIQVFYRFEKQIRNTLTTAINYLQQVKVEPIAEGIRSAIRAMRSLWSVISGAFAVVRPFLKIAIWGFKLLANHMETLVPYLRIALGAFIAYQAALKVGAFIRWVAVLHKLIAAQGILNVVMAANPIGAIITALALLAAAGVWVYQNWGLVKNAIVGVWNWLNKILDNPVVSATASVFAPWLFIPVRIIKYWRPLKDFFVSLWNVITKMVNVTKSIFSSSSGSSLTDPFAGVDRANSATSPNAAEIEARHKIDFNGRIDIAGAPDGTLFSAHTSGAPPIRMDFVGVNP